MDLFVDEDGHRTPFPVRVSIPVPGETSEDYYCVVSAPRLFSKEKSIFGGDALQARSLALQFLADMARGKRLVDAMGKQVDLAKL